MRNAQGRLIKFVTAVIALSMAACPLGWASLIAHAEPTTFQPFATVRPQDATFQAVFTATAPVETPMATLGAGQYFGDDDPNKPEVDPDSVVGDTRFGNGRLEGNPDLYVIWMTDENGTHYLTVQKDSEILSGGSDPASGFFNLVRERERIRGEIELAVADQSTERTARDWFAGGALGAVALGLVCVAITGGTCLAFVGVAGAAAWLSLSKDTEAELLQNQVDGHREDLAQIEGNLRFGFRVGQATGSVP